jgi:hypothetical protein
MIGQELKLGGVNLEVEARRHGLRLDTAGVSRLLSAPHQTQQLIFTLTRHHLYTARFQSGSRCEIDAK